MRILITGFRAKNGMINASEILLRSLIDETPDELNSKDLILKIVGDDTHGIKQELTQLLKDIQPEVCLFIGQAPGRNNITLETVATNYRYIGQPVKKGEAPPGDVIEVEGADAYRSNLPNMMKIIEKLNSSGIPAALSNDAGNSLCNQILYHGLHYGMDNDSKPLCGFLHIPALPEQVVKQWPTYPFMPLTMTRQAVAIILEALMAGFKK